MVATQKRCGTIERMPTGIQGLDELMEGGYVKNSTILVRGDTGTAKTLFCLNFLYHGAKDHNEPGVYITFSESEKAVYQHGRMFCWDLEELAKKNKFAVIRYEPHEVANIMEEGGGSIRDTIETLGAKRLAIDSLSTYQMVFENEYKATESVLNLFELLRKWDITSLVTSEFPVSVNRESGGRLGYLTDGIINLYYVRVEKHKYRALEIIKMRDTDHDDKINRFTIEDSGLKVYQGMKMHGRK
jgi:KaiC/GvpD/RAD55 family RecA-like ATPase